MNANHFQFRNFLKRWILLTLAIFLVYDVVWIATEGSGVWQYLAEDITMLFFDLIYCGVFALVSISVYSELLHSRLFDRLIARNKRGALFLTGGIVLLSNLLVTYVVDWMMCVLSSGEYFDSVWDKTVVLSLIAAMLSLVFMMQYFTHLMEKQNQERIELQKKCLKLQLDPHFVFNNLSTLAGMISVEPEKAEHYVVLLSHVYRYTLQHIDDDIMSIDESKDFVRKYIELLNLRFEDGIILNIDNCKCTSDECILTMSLQLLIENAVKHNTPHDGELLYIWIERSGNHLSVRNNRIHQDKTADSYGMGMENLRRRCLMRFGEEPKVICTETMFEVQMPISNRAL